MKKVPFTNNKASIVYAPDGQRVMPGDTRMIVVHDDAPVGAEPPADAIAELADGKANEIIVALGQLSAADVDRLLELERAGKARKSVIESCELRKLELLDAEEQARKEAAEAAADGESPSTDNGEAGGNAE